MMMTMAMISPHRGQSSLQISSPEEEQRVVVAPRRRLEKRLLFCGFCVGRINRAKVGHRGTWDPARRAGGAARGWVAPGTLLAAPWLPCGPPLYLRKLSER